MKVLFDHNVPRKLRRLLRGYDIRTAVEMGWADIENRELLTAAEDDGVDVMITGDKKLSYQQNLKGRRLALIVLSTNDWNILKLNPQPVLEALARVAPGSFERVPI